MKRYKSVYQSQTQLACAWANNKLSRHGDFFESCNMMCDHKSIYSYGRHFCIARKERECILFTERTYSKSTARHKNLVKCAVGAPSGRLPFQHHRGALIIPVPSLDEGSGPKEWMRDTLNEARTKFHNAKRARSLRPYKVAESVELFNRAAFYAEKFDLPLPTPAALPPGYLDFLVVESFKQKVDTSSPLPFPSLHSCYTTPAQALAA